MMKTMRSSLFDVRFMQPDDAREVARLHATTIRPGFLVRLGCRFLRQLYLGIAEAEGCRVFVAEDSQGILGFCAYTRSVHGMYRKVLRRRGIRLGLSALPFALNPCVVKEILETLRYPARQGNRDLPEAEILSIGVDSRARGLGVGRALLNEAIVQAERDEQGDVKVVAGARLEDANRFYQACGFERVDAITQHGETLYVYVKRL
jgi:ribosomal protein S18 acetylase RimI-like enzyme